MHAITDNLSNARRFSSLIVMRSMNLFYSMPYHRYIHVVLSSISTNCETAFRNLRILNEYPQRRGKRWELQHLVRWSPQWHCQKFNFFYFVTLSLVQESPFGIALMMGARLKSSSQHHLHSHFTEVYLLC